jgi:lipid-binding SYLF domain-containing protein
VKGLLTLVFIAPLLVGVQTGQKPATEKFKHARMRSEDAARIVSLLAEPNSGFPKELINRAQIVAVIPRATREDMLVRRFLQGYGVASARLENGWSLPAFYQFMSAPRKFTGTSQENLALIILFLDKEAPTWFAKDKSQFKRERAAVLGPVGVTEGQKNLTGIVAYSYYNGKLNGNEIDPDFFKDFILNQDNNINLPVYGVKARDVLAGHKIDSASLPTGISAFQEALQKDWSISSK